MAGVWKVLVVLVGLAVVACAIPHRRLRYEEVVAQALQFYNEGQQGQPLFRLLEATPPPSLNSKSRIPLNFRIKETVCIFTLDRQPGNCAFREGGEERICRGAFVRRRWVRALTLRCDRDQRRQPEDPQPEAAALKAQSTRLPPVVRDLYENAKYNIISNILRDF